MKLLMEQWKNYLDEIESFDTITKSQDDIKKSLEYFYKEHAPNIGKRKELGDWKGNKMVSFELPEGDRFFFVANEEDEPIAYLAVSPFRESYAVGNVRKLKGGGFYATELYEKVMEVLGKGSLYSDKAQTEGGKGIWDRFPAKERVWTKKEDGKRKWRWRISK